MPAEFAYVNPLDTADISLVDLQGKPLREGESSVYIPNGSGLPPDITDPDTVRWIATIAPTAAPEWNLWDLVRDPTQCLPVTYYNRTLAYAFVTPNVVEMATCEQRPIEELFQAKQSEVLDEDNRVRYNTADTSLAPSWWIAVTVRAREEWTSIASALAARTQEIVAGARLLENWYPTGPNQPRMAFYNAVNGNLRREPLTEAQYLQVTEEIGLHTFQTGNATFASFDNLETDYDAAVTAYDVAYAAAQAANPGGTPEEWDAAAQADPTYEAAWQTVADHDPQDPAWGYPPTVELDPQAIRQLGG